MNMLDVKEFKSNFGGSRAIPAMIDYSIKEKEFSREDLINIGVKTRLKNKTRMNGNELRKMVNYFLNMEFIKEKGDRLIFNKDFIPNSQK